MKRDEYKKVLSFFGDRRKLYIIPTKDNKSPLMKRTATIISALPSEERLYVQTDKFKILQTKKSNSVLIGESRLAKVLNVLDSSIMELRSYSVITKEDFVKEYYPKKRKKGINDVNIIVKGSKAVGNGRDWINSNYYRLVNERPVQELIMKNRLDAEFTNVVIQQPFYIEGHIYFADFFLPDYDALLEIDGNYHKKAKQREHDEERDFILDSVGYKTYRITNADVKNEEKIHNIIETIKNSKI